MKKLITLFAAILMAVGANAQEETLKFTSGNPDWGQSYVDDGVAFVWPGRQVHRLTYFFVFRQRSTVL